MGIKHNNYEDGNLQSLGYKNENGLDVTVGVIMPGTYNFGIAKRREDIHVIDGTLFSNGVSITQFSVSWGFKEGEEIKFSCTKPVAYICLYG